ncbi:MAG: hypothetical protein IPK33_29160 [Gemmatimonadetes bacterium]|jgi:hypothetical protein|nr:hypothetical protein [Gemmatimonadota bacterium]HNV75146.1 hypothetical protein [Gemmatimonadaceae bacterium]MBK7835437.1 hypothetical protein [Gemmatimonadota bacterium]MBK8061829.1 hypothetical protein [Gemmatimonadota bacterium]MBK8645486.1 hypothetical protein [Gemmatimonadota bacterium]
MADEARGTGDNREDQGAREAGWSGGGGARRTPSQQENDEAVAFGRKFGLGCFTFIVGGFSGGMVAVLIGQVVAYLSKAPKCEGLPVCNWYVYVGIGGILGALSLPTLVLMRLSRKR